VFSVLVPFSHCAVDVMHIYIFSMTAVADRVFADGTVNSERQTPTQTHTHTHTHALSLLSVIDSTLVESS
jgi:hypothetical protein